MCVSWPGLAFKKETAGDLSKCSSKGTSKCHKLLVRNFPSMNVFRHNAERRVGKFQNLLIISQQGLYTTVCCNSGVFWKKSHPLHAPPSPWNNAHCKSFYSKQANRQAPLCCVSHHFIASSICFLDLLESNTMKSSGEPPSPTLSLFRFLSPLFFLSCGFLSWRAAAHGCNWLLTFTTSVQTKTQLISWPSAAAESGAMLC